MDDFPSVMQRVLHAVNVRPALISLLKTSVSCSVPMIPERRPQYLKASKSPLTIS